MEHSELVKNLVKPADEINQQMKDEEAHFIHMILGIAGETGELIDAIKKYVIYHKNLDRDWIIEEMGDIEFYLEGLRQGLNIDRSEIIENNIVKLTKRYSLGVYTDSQAINRTDKLNESK